MKELKAQLKKKSGSFIQYIPEDGITVRFMDEPDSWLNYYEHYVEDTKTYAPCTDDCEHCADGGKPTQRYLANAVDVSENKVIPIKMPVTLASQIVKMYEKYSTLIDRDYELQREGSGKENTKYIALPESPRPMKLSRYEPLDLMSVLMSQLGDDEDDEDDDEVEAAPPARRTRPSTAGAPKAAPAKKVVRRRRRAV